MIWNNVELFNVSEVKEHEDGSLTVYRFTSKAREAFADGMRDYAVGVGEMTTGCEIRFVGEGADISFHCTNDNGSVEIYRGDFFVRRETIQQNTDHTVVLRSDLGTDRHNIAGYKGKYGTAVWRVVFGHEGRLKINSIKPISDIRPPVASELPEKSVIAYGSSITHSAFSVAFTNSYVYTLGRCLGAQMLCKGMAGCCFAQKDVVDFIADQPTDAALLELGINMIDTPIDVAEFERRADYAVKRVLASGKKVILISNFTSHHNLSSGANHEKNEQFVNKLEEIYENNKCDNLFYVSGREIVNDLSFLSADILHPAPYGHISMGHRIAEKLRELGFEL